jgi:serine/threonine protein kinase
MRVKKFVPESMSILILKQIVNGMKDFYKARILHRDIKLENILINFPDMDVYSLS